MAKSKALIAAEARIAELLCAVAGLETKVAALEAKVVIARVCYRALRDSVRTVDHSVTIEHRTSAKPMSMPIVTRYRDALGREWIKTRIGNTATSRLADHDCAIESIAS